MRTICKSSHLGLQVGDQGERSSILAHGLQGNQLVTQDLRIFLPCARAEVGILLVGVSTLRLQRQ